MDQNISSPGVQHAIDGVIYPPAADLARHLASGALGRLSLIAALTESFRANSGRTALIGAGWSMSYGTLDERSDRAALAFCRLGLNPLDRVVFQAGNSANLVVAIMGCLKAGLIPLCTLHAHREIEIIGLGTHAGARAHFIETAAGGFDYLTFAAKMRGAIPGLDHTIVIAGGSGTMPSLDALIDAVDPAEARRFALASVAAIDPFQVAFFQISGGSTGLPKIIPRFQNDYVANLRAVMRVSAIGREDCVLSPGPMLHNAPFSCFWGPAMLAGAQLAIPANLREDGLAALFAACRPTWMHLPQPLFPKIAKLFAENPEVRSSLRGIGTSGGGAEIERVLGVPVHLFYGMTEGIIVYPRFGAPAAYRHGTVGWPIADGDEIRIVYPGTEDEAAPGEPGELLYRGPYVFHGYYNAPVQTASGMTPDGWVRSGDLIQQVTIEGSRGLLYKGRLKDLISRGGEKISCEEVEQYARTHPAILDIVVVPAPCPVYAERGAAFVVVEPGHDCPDLAALGRHLGEQGLAKFKWPERLYVIDVLPTTNSGKLDRPGLRRQAEALAEQTA